MIAQGTTKLSCGAAPRITGIVQDTAETTPQPISAAFLPGVMPSSRRLPIRWFRKGRTSRWMAMLLRVVIDTIVTFAQIRIEQLFRLGGLVEQQETDAGEPQQGEPQGDETADPFDIADEFRRQWRATVARQQQVEEERAAEAQHQAAEMDQPERGAQMGDEGEVQTVQICAPGKTWQRLRIPETRMRPACLSCDVGEFLTRRTTLGGGDRVRFFLFIMTF